MLVGVGGLVQGLGGCGDVRGSGWLVTVSVRMW